MLSVFVSRAAGKLGSGRDGKPSTSSMAQNFGLLARELELMFGDTQLIPTRADLRAMTRNDIDKVRICSFLDTWLQVHEMQPFSTSQAGVEV